MPRDIMLEVAVVLPTGQEPDRIAAALHLLATWAVRAARARGAEQVPLDSSPPGSDECTPNPSPGEEMT